MADEDKFTDAYVLLIDPKTLDTGSLLFYLTLNNKSHITRVTTRTQLLIDLEK